MDGNIAAEIGERQLLAPFLSSSIMEYVHGVIP